MNSFSHISLPTGEKTLPVEVTLLHQFDSGTGTQVIKSAMEKQREHPEFIDELNEPSTKIGDIHCKQSDHSSLYTFAIEQQGHPFHRHVGNRMFTAISGSSGTLLRFSLTIATKVTPEPFIEKLRNIIVPSDCLFTVRFGGGTWHQFLPLNQTCPALFAISCHTNELSGIDNPSLIKQIQQNKASIPMLTELLPDKVQKRLTEVNNAHIPTNLLTL